MVYPLAHRPLSPCPRVRPSPPSSPPAHPPYKSSAAHRLKYTPVPSSRRTTSSKLATMHRLHARADTDECGAVDHPHTWTGLRIASIFIILATSMFGALFPVLARRQRLLKLLIPERAFKVAKYFGSGVIVRLGRSTLRRRSPFCLDCDRLHPPSEPRIRRTHLRLPGIRVAQLRAYRRRLPPALPPTDVDPHSPTPWRSASAASS